MSGSDATIIASVGGKKLRCTLLAGGIIRVEAEAAVGGFVDKPTFTVVSRPPVGRDGSGLLNPSNRRPPSTGAPPEPSMSAGENPGEILRYGSFVLRQAQTGSSLAAAEARSVPPLELLAGETVVWASASDPALRSTPPQPSVLPRPGAVPAVWPLHDRPRVVPPTWGALPPPEPASEAGAKSAAVIPDSEATSGWTCHPDVLDVYLCICNGDRRKLIEQFISLTGRTPVPPVWTFGLWTSRYYPYSSEAALALIDRYRSRGFPLDVLLMDTDWRIGASRGYKVNNDLFPDMEAFLSACGARGVRTVFNDHPEHRGLEPLDPELFRYRYQNLTRLLKMGLTAWWFDRNWGRVIQGPLLGLETAVWGQRLYYDIVADAFPEKRPVILSMTNPHPAAHRFPIWWNGDNYSDWRALSEAVEDAVEDGLQLRPYTGSDVGGHLGFPSPEQYVRWIQWGAVAPTLRLHCGPKNRTRYPWAYGVDAEEIARDFISWRYRLVPYLYSLAHQAYADGTPLHRSILTEDPEAPFWAQTTEFLLGRNLLIAPVLFPIEKSVSEPSAHRFSSPLRRRVWKYDDIADVAWGLLKDGRDPEPPPAVTGFDEAVRITSLVYTEVNAEWGHGFLVIWDGTFDIPTKGFYRFRLAGNGLKALFVDDAPHGQLFHLVDGGTNEAYLDLEPGTHTIWVGYRHDSGRVPVVTLSLDPAAELSGLRTLTDDQPVRRPVWIPPGRWRDLSTGKTYSQGSCRVELSAEIDTLPALVRCPSVFASTIAADHLPTGLWESLVIDVFLATDDGESRFTVTEDDGETIQYRDGEVFATEYSITQRGHRAVVSRQVATDVDPWVHRRQEVVRVHLPAGAAVESVSLDGRSYADWEVLPVVPGRRTPFCLDHGQAQFEDSDTVGLSLNEPYRDIEIVLSR